MAFVQDNQNQDQKDDKQGQPQPLAGSSQGGGVATGNGGISGSNQQSSSTQPQGTSSGRYTNISNYLKANQGYNQAQGGLAGKIGGNIQQEQQKTADAIAQSKTQFGQASQQGRNQFNQGLYGQATGDAANFVQDPKLMQQFQQMRENNYSGPNDLTNAQALQGQVGNIQDLTNQTGSEGGRFNLLRQMFNKPSYTSGQQRLDQLLLQGNQGQLGQLAGTRRLANQAAQGLSQASQAAQNQAQGYQNEALATQKQVGEGVTGEMTNEDKSISDKVTAAEKFRTEQLPRIQQGLSSGQLTQDDINYLGLNEGQNLYNIDPNKYLTSSDLQATKQNVASADDYARMQALGKLAGNYTKPDTDQLLAQYSNPAEAGIFAKQGGAQFDKNKFLQDVQGAGEEYQNKLQTNQALVDQDKGLLPQWEQQVGQSISQLNGLGLRDTYGNPVNFSNTGDANLHSAEAIRNLMNQVAGANGGGYGTGQSSPQQLQQREQALQQASQITQQLNPLLQQATDYEQAQNILQGLGSQYHPDRKISVVRPS